MELEVIKSNKKEWTNKGFVFHKAKDAIIIGSIFTGKHEIPCSEVKEFTILDEKSSSVKTKNIGGTVGGALLGGLLTGGIGAIVGGMAGGNDLKKDLSVKMGFKLKSGDWFVGSLKLEDQKGIVGFCGKTVLKAIQSRFAVTEECPF